MRILCLCLFSLALAIIGGCQSKGTFTLSYLQENPQKHHVKAHMGDTIRLRVPEGHNSHYTWEIQDQYHWKLDNRKFKKGHYIYTFTAQHAGEGTLVMVYTPQTGTFEERSLKSLTLSYIVKRENR